MKAKSIMVIREMLKKERDEAFKDYKNTKEHLIEKYGTEWLDKVIDDFEKKELHNVQERYWQLDEVYKDFENYEW